MRRPDGSVHIATSLIVGRERRMTDNEYCSSGCGKEMRCTVEADGRLAYRQRRE